VTTGAQLSDGPHSGRDRVSENWLAGVGLRLSAWFERWFPDAFALALLVVVMVFLASLVVGASPAQAAGWFGSGFWDLVPFTMQMTMVIVTGYVAATAPPVHRLIRGLATWPKSPAAAIAFVALFSMVSSLVSWSFSMIFSGLLAREVSHRVRGADYRAVGAAAYLGVGSVWALGLSSSAALIMATPSSLPPSLLAISGVIPLSDTLLLWQSMFMALVLIVVSVVVAVYSAPRPEHALSMEDMGVIYEAGSVKVAAPDKPGEWLEHSPILSMLIGGLGLAYLGQLVALEGPGVLLQLNRYIFLFLMAGILLHWRPVSFVRAVGAAVPSVAGVLVQYPLYAGMVRIMTESGLAAKMAEMFVAISNEHTFPILVGIYSAVLGIFIPSAGGKWLVEAPYVLPAAMELGVNVGWVVQTYNATEALANLIHPFWMLPLLGILGIKARDIVGYCSLQFAIHVPVVLLLVWALSYTFP
jgi:short-chain fatty acids transporter